MTYSKDKHVNLRNVKIQVLILDPGNEANDTLMLEKIFYQKFLMVLGLIIANYIWHIFILLFNAYAI